MERAVSSVARESLWRNPAFVRLWSAQAISVSGSALTRMALPLIAVAALGATPQQMGLLVAAETAPALLLRLPIAAWADAKPYRIAVMVACHVLSGLLVATIPLCWLFGVLHFGVLLLVALSLSVVSAVGGVFSSPVLPELLARDQLVEANGKLSATRGLAEVSGRSLSGALLGLMSAPLMLLIDAVSFLVAAVLTCGVRVPPRSQPQSQGHVTSRGLLQGLKPLFSQRLLRAGVSATAYLSFANGVVSALLVLYMVGPLGLPASLVGPIIGAGSIGGIIAGISVNAIHRRLGLGPTLVLAITLLTWSFALLPFAQPGVLGALACLNYELVGSFGAVLLVVTLFSEVPGRVPPSTVAQAMAAVSLVPESTALIGALLGGVLGTLLGVRASLGVSLALVLVANLVLAALVSRTRRKEHTVMRSPRRGCERRQSSAPESVMARQHGRARGQARALSSPWK